VSASDVDPLQISVTPTGRKPTVRPRPLTKREIQATVADFGRAARNALVAGFDGVQILANYLYLISQFLTAATNLRKDENGGSLENRSRFPFEVVEAVLNEVDAKRVGVKISPMHEGRRLSVPVFASSAAPSGVPRSAEIAFARPPFAWISQTRDSAS
jgi:N-ethylmaleimide reductase